MQYGLPQEKLVTVA